MADQAREFIANSNTAVRVTLTQPADPSKDVEFHPAFTYSIFGNEEIIFGYKHLSIDLTFAADTLQAGLAIEHSDLIERVGDTKPDVVEDKLKDFLPTISFGERKDGEEPPQVEHPHPFVPPGELVHSYKVNSRRFGIWEVNLTDPRAKQILRHMQIFVHFFIEGGSFIDLDDPEWTIERWTVYFLYAIDAHPQNPSQSIYSLAGDSTAYRLFHLDLTQPSYLLTPPSSQPSTNPPEEAELPSPLPKLQSQLPSRQRISQFIILPPYQRTSHGSNLYSTMLSRATTDPTILELTVEDPNESFDDLRDTTDLLRLRATNAQFRALRLNSDVKLPLPEKSSSAARAHCALPTSQLITPATITEIKKSSRLCDRQLSRLVEMQTLSAIPASHRSTTRITKKDKASSADDRAYYWWRMLVKQRLTKHNSDALQQLEIEERVEKLEETLESVVVGYMRVLERCEGRCAVLLEGEVGVGGAGGKEREGKDGKRKGKRKVIHEDGEEGEEMPIRNGTPRKKVRVVGSDDE